MAQSLPFFKKLSFIAHLTGARASRGHLPVWRQASEMILLRALNGIGPEYYHTAGFWRRGVDWQRKRSHLGARDYERLLAQLNPPEYRKLSQNKLSESALLAFLNVPSTRYIGYFQAQRGTSRTGKPLTSLSDLLALLSRKNIRAVCCKPLEGWAGQGVCAFALPDNTPKNSVLNLQTGSLDTTDHFTRQHLAAVAGPGMVVEEYLKQHPDLSAFNPSSLNTLRIWVFKNRGGECTSLGGYLRIGRTGSIVDNQSAGGIVARVDQETGVLAAAHDGLPSHEVYAKHPDSGAQIEGEVVPMWPEARKLAEDALGIFPKLRFAGLDIAIAPDTPRVVELNVKPDLTGAAYMDLPFSQIMDDRKINGCG
jgi:hypothetical protein